MIGIVDIDHLHGSLGWRRFIAEQRNRLPEIPDAAGRRDCRSRRPAKVASDRD
jgi:hypothetical protein